MPPGTTTKDYLFRDWALSFPTDLSVGAALPETDTEFFSRAPVSVSPNNHWGIERWHLAALPIFLGYRAVPPLETGKGFVIYKDSVNLL